MPKDPYPQHVHYLHEYHAERMEVAHRIELMLAAGAAIGLLMPTEPPAPAGARP